MFQVYLNLLGFDLVLARMVLDAPRNPHTTCIVCGTIPHVVYFGQSKSQRSVLVAQELDLICDAAPLVTFQGHQSVLVSERSIRAVESDSINNIHSALTATSNVSMTSPSNTSIQLYVHSTSERDTALHLLHACCAHLLWITLFKLRSNMTLSSFLNPPRGDLIHQMAEVALGRHFTSIFEVCRQLPFSSTTSSDEVLGIGTTRLGCNTGRAL